MKSKNLVLTGADRLIKEQFESIKWRDVGLICNASSIDADYNYFFEVLSNSPDVELSALFGPQHGLFPHTPENMVEWEGAFDERLGVKIYSLYGESRKPSKEALEDVDILLFDIQDVGSRYYTYIWTMSLAMERCAEMKREFIVLDRPNPITGAHCTGPLIDDQFRSFVGRYSLPIRHGMTVGEIANFINREIGCELSIIQMRGWDRAMWYDETGLPWVPPSPNMPTLNTAIVYPGMCLLEGTNLSEGRGTTYPFEVFGAPFIDPFELKRVLDKHGLPGLYFRPLYFTPQHSKWAGEKCGGIFIHVRDRGQFLPILTGLAVIQATLRLYPNEFRWGKPPYEYEYEKYPFDILTGDSDYRQRLEGGEDIVAIQASWESELADFKVDVQEYLLY